MSRATEPQRGGRSGWPLLAGLLVTCLGVGPVCAAQAADENSCVVCHRRAETVREFDPWEQDQFVHWYGSVHGQAGVTCEQCHGGNAAAASKWRAHWGVGTSREARSPVYYKNVPKTCGACHEAVYESFTASRHYKELISDHLAPSCNTCHGFQMDTPAVTPAQLVSRCALCHNPDTGTRPDVVKVAKRALEANRTARNAIREGRAALEAARAQGRDSGEAAALLDSAEEALSQTGAHWHSFQVHKFKYEVEHITKSAEKARHLATTAASAD